MRILFVSARFHTNQVETMRALLAAGHRVWFHAATVGATENHRDVVPHVHRPSLVTRWAKRWWGPSANDRWYCPALFSYWNVMRGIAPDIVIIRWHNPLFCRLAGIYARLMGCRTVVYEQISADLLDSVWSAGCMGWLRRKRFLSRQWLLKAAWMTPLPSKVQLPRGCYFVPFAVPIARESQRPSSAPGILEIGKFVPRKNHFLFVEAIKRLIKQSPVHATIIGEASTDSQRDLLGTLTDTLREKGLDRVVAVRSNIPHDEMSEVYDQHAVFVLPAIAEPAAISPLEAMGRGLPVVVTEDCGTKWYVREGIDGFVCEPNSAAALAEAMRKALELSQQHAARERIRASAITRFSGKAFLAAFEAMMKQHFGDSFWTQADDLSRGNVRRTI